MMAEDKKAFDVCYRYRLYPTPEQEEWFRMNMSCCDFVYNHYLAERKRAYRRTQETVRRPVLAEGSSWDDDKPKFLRDEGGRVVYEEIANEQFDPEAKPMSFFDTSKDLTVLKRNLVDEGGERWLQRADSVSLVYALRHLDQAYQNFFKHGARYPKRRKPGQHLAYRTKARGSDIRAGESPSSAYIVLPKVSAVPMVMHRPYSGTPYAATVSAEKDGRWYVSVSCKDVEMDEMEACGAEVGITTGIREWLVTSDGAVFDNPRRSEKTAKKLARMQRQLSRKQGAKKGEKKSKGYIELEHKIARLKVKEKNQRRDDTHKLTHRLVTDYGLIVSREMEVQQMMRKDKRDGALPIIAQKVIHRGLADANLFEINRQLAYKSEWCGRTFVLLESDYPTAQTCSECGAKYEILAKDLRSTWTCPECGTAHDRKHNGAVNVLEAGKCKLAGRESKTSKNRKTQGRATKGKVEPTTETN